MSAPQFRFVRVLGHEIHVTEWGDPGNPALVMWHGLARTGRDFDELALALSDRYFVICPDTIGRGLSTWASNPDVEYSVRNYSSIALGLLDFYQLSQASWIGTSMGGMIGMRIASGPSAERLNALIINDIGPEIPQEAIDRILSYAATSPDFASMVEAEAWFRSAYVPFGPNSDAFWQRMARTSVRRCGDGRLTLHYDPKITVQFTASQDELTVWDRFDRIETPMHVLRGAQSDILTAEIAEKMQGRGPRPGLTVIPNCGHAPTMAQPGEAQLIRAILDDLRG
jgi:pimeloyl-ACP methyl ester carboxylesterase